jgi:hypothetical protein
MNVLAAFRSMLTQTPASVVLTRRGDPVTSAVQVARWRTESEGAAEIMRATVEFGPFPTDASFDGARLVMAGGVEDETFTGPVQLPAGMVFSYDFEVRFSRDG